MGSATNLLPPLPAECSGCPEPRAWQHSPQRRDARRPHPTGFFPGMCWALGLVPFLVGQVGGRRRSTGAQSALVPSLLCAGSNPILPTPFPCFPRQEDRAGNPTASSAALLSSGSCGCLAALRGCAVLHEVVGLLPDRYGALLYTQGMFWGVESVACSSFLFRCCCPCHCLFRVVHTANFTTLSANAKPHLSGGHQCPLLTTPLHY